VKCTTSLMCMLLAILITALVYSTGLCNPSIKITLTHWWGGAAQTALEKVFLPSFEERFPEVEVEQRMIGWGEYYDKWVMSAASGVTMGDLVLLDAKFAQDIFVLEGTVRDLTPFLERDDIDTNDFSQAALRQFRPAFLPGGPIYAVPIVSGTIVPFYNIDMLSEAGMNAPDKSWTWDHFFAIARKMRVMDGEKVERYGFGGWCQGILEAMIPAYGGRLLSEDRSQPVMDSPEVVKALTQLQEAYLSQTFGGSFTAEQTPFSFHGDWDPGWWGELPFEWDIMPVPKGPHGRYTTAWANGLAIPQGVSGDKLKMAWELLKYYAMNPDRTGIPDIYLNMMPSYIPLAVGHEYLEAQPFMNRRLIVDMHIQNQILVELTPNFIEWHDRIWGGYSWRAVTGELAPRNAVKQVQELIRNQQLLKH